LALSLPEGVLAPMATAPPPSAAIKAMIEMTSAGDGSCLSRARTVASLPWIVPPASGGTVCRD
jgi:hypothetical protein